MEDFVLASYYFFLKSLVQVTSKTIWPCNFLGVKALYFSFPSFKQFYEGTIYFATHQLKVCMTGFTFGKKLIVLFFHPVPRWRFGVLLLMSYTLNADGTQQATVTTRVTSM